MSEALWIPAGPSPLTTHRIESWRVGMVGSSGAPLGDLDGVSSCLVDLNVFAPISGGGDMYVDDRGTDIDWLNTRVQPWWQVQGMEPWPLGVFLTSAPRETHTEAGRAWRIEMLDKLSILAGDAIDGSYSVAAGAKVTDAVRDVIEWAGEDAVSITESDETLSEGLIWTANTTKLRIANDLLGVINYFSLRCDGYGQYVAEPYVRAQDRTPAWDFAEGEASILSPDFDRNQDLGSIPNKVVLVSVGTYNTESLVAVATNEDPESRFSYQARDNRWIVHTDETVEVTSQAVLDAMAERKLAELTSAAATLELEWAAVPLALNNTVSVNADGVSTVAAVQKMRHQLGVGSLVRGTVREVAA